MKCLLDILKHRDMFQTRDTEQKVQAAYCATGNVVGWRIALVDTVANVQQFQHKVPSEVVDWQLVTETLYLRTAEFESSDESKYKIQ